MPRIIGKITFWRVLAAVIIVLGLIVTVRRFFFGLGTVTNLSDGFPWGLWIGFDVVSGVALAAGAFSFAFLCHVVGYGKCHPVIRPAILTGFIGYILVCVGLMYDLGKYYYIWHAITMWNHHSVMLEVAWCVMLYTTVLAIEFSPMVFEKFNLDTPRRIIAAVTIPLIITGIILSMLHQSSLGSLFLIVPEKLHPLWYSPLLPVLFFISAFTAGPAMVIFESTLSARVFKRGLPMETICNLSRFLLMGLVVYVAFRIQDLVARGALGEIFTGSFESIHFILEMLLFIIPMIILARRRAEEHLNWVFAASIMVPLGVVYNRINTCIVGMIRSSGTSYFPKWDEFVISIFLVTLGVIAFYLADKYLPVFPKEEELLPGELGAAAESA